MQGYLLPLALAALLAAPVVWRLGDDVGESRPTSGEAEASATPSALSLTSFAAQSDRAAEAGERPMEPEAAVPANVFPASSRQPESVSTAED